CTPSLGKFLNRDGVQSGLVAEGITANRHESVVRAACQKLDAWGVRRELEQLLCTRIVLPPFRSSGEDRGGSPFLLFDPYPLDRNKQLPVVEDKPEPTAGQFQLNLFAHTCWECHSREGL